MHDSLLVKDLWCAIACLTVELTDFRTQGYCSIVKASRATCSLALVSEFYREMNFSEFTKDQDSTGNVTNSSSDYDYYYDYGTDPESKVFACMIFFSAWNWHMQKTVLFSDFYDK